MHMLPLRILVLVDTPCSGSKLANRLRQAGCQEVFVATQSAPALAFLEQNGSVDITLCDLPMESAGAQDLLQTMGRYAQYAGATDFAARHGAAGRYQ